jgi:hypothetical protein
MASWAYPPTPSETKEYDDDDDDEGARLLPFGQGVKQAAPAITSSLPTRKSHHPSINTPTKLHALWQAEINPYMHG